MAFNTISHEYKAQRITVLTELDRADEAQKILEKVCWQVQPIMRKHQWSVALVTEFLPRSPNLLGMNTNSGEKIEIRMRKSKTSDFLPYEDLLGTMLHELVHNEIGPHNAKFYKLLDELTKECDELLAKGTGGRGAGFDLPGMKLSNEAHNPSSSRDGRMKALKAAEDRTKKQQLMTPGGGIRLGGQAPPSNRTPAQMAAEAAMRRAKDDLWCHTGRDSVQGLDTAHATLPSDLATTSTQDGSAGVTKTADCARPASLAQEPPAKGDYRRQSAEKQPTPVRSASSSGSGRDLSASVITKKPRLESKPADWNCAVCTLRNTGTSTACTACETPKPTPATRAAGPMSRRLCAFGAKCGCGDCKANGVNKDPSAATLPPRSCPTCTYLNISAGDSCTVCGTTLPDKQKPGLATDIVVLD